MDSLRAALPKVRCDIDLKMPEEAKIIDSLKKLPKAPLKYQALYNVLLDSELRLVEAIELINNYKDVEAVNGFYRLKCQCSEAKNKPTMRISQSTRSS